VAEPAVILRHGPLKTAPLLARHWRPLLRLTALVIGAFAVKSFVLDPLTGHFTGEFEDFSAYIGAARSMAHGGSPYSNFDPSTVVMSGFDYPPFAAVLIRPLALLPDRAALVVWLTISLVCALASAVVVARTAFPASWPRVELALVAALAFAPATYNYWHGQINSVIFLLLALAFRAYARDRRIQTGVILGLAAGIKLAPLVLILLLLKRRWWRSAAAMLGTALCTVVVGVAVLGVDTTRAFIFTVLPALNRGTGWIYNQTLGGAINRLFNHSVLHVEPAALSLQLASTAAGIAVLLVAVWVTRSGVRPVAERGAEFSLGITAMVLAGSIAWFPHFIHLLIPVFAATGLIAARTLQGERSLARATVAVVVVFGVLAPGVIAALSIGWLGSLSVGAGWWPFLQLCSLPCLAVLWLAVATARSLRLGAFDLRPLY
jgi:alpha-1,2-mannosyltransferase